MELEQLAGGFFPLSHLSAPGRTNLPGREAFRVGERVRVLNDFFPGHVRMPTYPFPDAHAHGVEAADEPTYDVAFRAEDLWPKDADPALVHVGVFESYLEHAD